MSDRARRRGQLLTVVLCWCAYACIYFGRVNFSMAIPGLQSFFGAGKEQIGFANSLFLWVYGVGQLINGMVGDRVSGRGYIAAGLAAAGIVNLAVGFAPAFAVVCALWAVNGFAQSMLWGPMSRIISTRIPPARSGSAIVAVSTSLVGGYLLAWGFSGKMLADFGWRSLFLIPGATILLFMLVWIGLIGPTSSAGVRAAAASGAEAASVAKEEKRAPLWQAVKRERLWFAALACIAQGIVKDGISIWAPVFFLECYHVNLTTLTAALIGIPLMNFAGMVMAGWLNRRLHGSVNLTTAVLFMGGLAMIGGLLVFGGSNIFLGMVFLGLASAAMYGANTLLLGIIPLQFQPYGRVSSVAGLLDFTAYIASGFAAAATGVIVGSFGWHGVIVFWLLTTLAGVVSLATGGGFRKGTEKAASQD